MLEWRKLNHSLQMLGPVAEALEVNAHDLFLSKQLCIKIVTGAEMSIVRLRYLYRQ